MANHQAMLGPDQLRTCVCLVALLRGNRRVVLELLILATRLCDECAVRLAALAMGASRSPFVREGGTWGTGTCKKPVPLPMLEQKGQSGSWSVVA
jgi:hypothetical protein